MLWAVNNGTSRLQRLLWNGTQWVRDTANGWSAGKTLHFPGGAGLPDSEGVTLTDAGSAGGVFVSSERNLTAGATSRVSVLRYDVSGAAATLTATQEWNLTPDLPAVGTNAGAESVEWVPDTYLVGSGFVDADDGSALRPGGLPRPRHRAVLRRPRGQRDRLRLRPRPDLEQLHPRGHVRQRLLDLRGAALGR